MWEHMKTETNGQMLMRAITVLFLKWFSLWLWHVLIYLAVSGEVFSPFESEFYFCKEFGPFLYHICYSGAENVCHPILRAELTHSAFSLLPGLSLCHPVFIPPCLPTPSHFVFVSVIGEWFYCVPIVTIKVLQSRESILCFHLSSSVLTLFLFLQT